MPCTASSKILVGGVRRARERASQPQTPWLEGGWRSRELWWCAFNILMSDTVLDNHVVWTFVFYRPGFASFFEEIHGLVVFRPACHHIWWNNCRLCDGTRILQVFDSFFELLFDVGMNTIHAQFLFYEERSWDFELGVVNEGVVTNPDSMRWREMETIATQYISVRGEYGKDASPDISQLHATIQIARIITTATLISSLKSFIIVLTLTSSMIVKVRSFIQ